MRTVFEQFAEEERGHKNKLVALKAGHLVLGPPGKVVDLKIGDYLVDVKPSPDLDYQGVLILAMKREKAAFKLYSDLATFVSDAGVRASLLQLAQEEAKHKLRFEIEYADHVLKEN